MIGVALLTTTLGCAPLRLRADPAPGLGRSQSWSRNLDCERITAEAGAERYPGQIDSARPRGDYAERSAIVCRERLTRPGLREPGDEAILSRLDAGIAELASAAEALRPDLKDRTWLVEAYFPSPPVAAKISFAAKNALMRRGLRVSDRAPALAAADIDVLTRLGPDEAFPAACRRYFATGSLGESDSLLAVLSRDPRETILHAGICTQGQWVWLK